MLVTIVALIFILDLYPTTGNIYFSSKVRVDSFGEGAGKSVLLTNQSHHVAVVTRCSLFEVCWIVFLSKKDLRFTQKDGNNEIYFWKKKNVLCLMSPINTAFRLLLVRWHSCYLRYHVFS